MPTKLGKTFDWNVEDILDALNPKDAFEKACVSFSHLAKCTACFDSFSHKVKLHRFTQVVEAYADRVEISAEKAKSKLLEYFYSVEPDYYSIEVEGYERVDVKEAPLPVPEDVMTTTQRAGYVTPEGIFFGCCLEGHYDLCADLVKLGMIPKNIEPHNLYAYPDDMGWLKVSELSRLVFKFNFYDKEPTLQQREFIQKAMERHSAKSFELNGKKNVLELKK